MAVIGITLDRDNPEFTIDSMKFWMPQLKNYLNTQEGITAFNNLYPIANNKIFASIFGPDWPMAMSLCIAHYIMLLAALSGVPAGSSLSELVSGQAARGLISSASVGSFNVTYEIDKTVVDTDEAKWWNLTDFGAQLMALLAGKGYAGGIFVVTSNPIAIPTFSLAAIYVEINLGDSFLLEVTTSDGSKPAFTSSNATIATVSSTGLIASHNLGYCKIFVTLGKLVKECKVIVK